MACLSLFFSFYTMYHLAIDSQSPNNFSENSGGRKRGCYIFTVTSAPYGSIGTKQGHLCVQKVSRNICPWTLEIFSPHPFYPLIQDFFRNCFISFVVPISHQVPGSLYTFSSLRSKGNSPLFPTQSSLSATLVACIPSKSTETPEKVEEPRSWLF